MLTRILMVLAVLIVVYLLYYYFFVSSEDVTLTGVEDAGKQKIIPGSDLKNGPSNDYTISVWLYINDWSQGLGDAKVVYTRNGGSNADGEPIYFPRMELGAFMNTVNFKIAQLGTSAEQTATTNFECGVDGVPIQKWTNIVMSINNRAVDIYMDGKLVKTCIMEGLAALPLAETPITLTPAGASFNGKTSRLRYIGHAVSPAEAFNIYMKGYKSSSFGGLSTYGMSFEITEGEKSIAALSI